MADTFGLSFAPLDNPQNPQQPNGGNGYGGGQVSPVQQAIQILSLRQPRVFGANAPAAPQLLNAAGGGGVPDLQALLRALMQHFQGQMGMPDQGMSAIGGGGPNPTAGGGAAPPGGPMGNPLASIFGVPTGPAPMPTPPSAPLPRIIPGGEPEPSPTPYEDSPAPPPAAAGPFFGGGRGDGGRGKGNREF